MLLMMTKNRIHSVGANFAVLSVRLGYLLLCLHLAACLHSNAARAQGAERKAGTVTGLPLPRFVSLKSDEVNARVGPGGDYAIAWVFRRPGLPVEIIAEFESWRQIRDSEGGTGWVAASLLSGKRTALVAPWIKKKTLFKLSSSRDGSAIVAEMEPGTIVDVANCDGASCEVYAANRKGWVQQNDLWGVYPGEKVN